MHVCVVNLTNGGLSGGYRKYLQVMEPLLRAHPGISRLDVFSPSQAGADSRSGHQSWPARDRWLGHRVLRSRLLALAPDVVFFPTAARVDCGSIPNVVMVRNMEPLLVPFGGNTLGEGLKNVIRRRVAKVSCRRATRVIAVSGFVRDFITGSWRIDERKVGVVYHGVDEADALPKAPPALAGRAPTRFLFTAGSIRPARGLEDAIKALALSASAGIHYDLVVAGEANPGSEPYRREIDRLASQLGVASQVIWAGQLSRGEMAWCFRHCAAFVMTSRAEACPNTVLEALREGVVSISTDTEPMPEFFADGAIFYRREDAASLAEQFTVLSRMDGAERERLRARALSRAGHFTWRATVEGTIRELRMAIDHG
jgi:glycosyltransferase involved in cell wall biosynthesis